MLDHGCLDIGVCREISFVAGTFSHRGLGFGRSSVTESPRYFDCHRQGFAYLIVWILNLFGI